MNEKIIENTLLTLIDEFKKDEEEKYNALENTIKSIHKSFLDEEELKTYILNKFFPQIKRVIKEVKEEMKIYPPQFCIFNAINLQRYENYNSNLIAKLLEVNIEYEGAKLSFVKDFLMYLHKDKEFSWNYGLKNIEELEKINHSDISIKREEYADSRRMDLFISYKKDFAIIIENKIYAREQDNQLEDYYIKKKDNYKNLYIIFLTPSGYESSTLSEKSKKELENNYQTLKHSDIALWLESILENKKYSFLHSENILDNDNKYIKDYRLLKSAMIQTIHNANILSNNTKELDMTKGKIQELLEDNIFKDIQTVEDVEEYKKIFNSVNELLDEKKIEIMININWQFTQKVVNYFEDNKIDYYESLSYIEYKNKYLNNEYVWSIKLGDINNFCIVIESNYSDAYIGFGILTTSDRIRNNIENNKLFTSINDIFSRLEKKNNHGNWVYHTDIFLEKDSPEEIAEAIIKLYNLLKENL